MTNAHNSEGCQMMQNYLVAIFSYCILTGRRGVGVLSMYLESQQKRKSKHICQKNRTGQLLGGGSGLEGDNMATVDEDKGEIKNDAHFSGLEASLNGGTAYGVGGHKRKDHK